MKKIALILLCLLFTSCQIFRKKEDVSKSGVAILQRDCTNNKNYESCGYLGILLYYKNIPDQARKFLQVACTNNDAPSCNTLGELDQREGNYIKAKENFDKSCMAGFTLGCTNDQLMSHFNIYIQENAKFDEECSKQNSESCYHLGLIYLQKSNLVQSLKYFLKSCQLDNPESCKETGFIYKVLHEKSKALLAFDKACKLHNESACLSKKNLAYNARNTTK